MTELQHTNASRLEAADNMYEIVVLSSKALEAMFRQANIQGKGLHEYVTAAGPAIPQPLAKKLRWIASVRNGVIHEDAFVEDVHDFKAAALSALPELAQCLGVHYDPPSLQDDTPPGQIIASWQYRPMRIAFAVIAALIVCNLIGQAMLPFNFYLFGKGSLWILLALPALTIVINAIIFACVLSTVALDLDSALQAPGQAGALRLQNAKDQAPQLGFQQFVIGTSLIVVWIGSVIWQETFFGLMSVEWNATEAIQWHALALALVIAVSRTPLRVLFGLCMIYTTPVAIWPQFTSDPAPGAALAGAALLAILLARPPRSTTVVVKATKDPMKPEVLTLEDSALINATPQPAQEQPVQTG